MILNVYMLLYFAIQTMQKYKMARLLHIFMTRNRIPCHIARIVCLIKWSVHPQHGDWETFWCIHTLLLSQLSKVTLCVKSTSVKKTWPQSMVSIANSSITKQLLISVPLIAILDSSHFRLRMIMISQNQRRSTATFHSGNKGLMVQPLNLDLCMLHFLDLCNLKLVTLLRFVHQHTEAGTPPQCLTGVVLPSEKRTGSSPSKQNGKALPFGTQKF